MPLLHGELCDDLPSLFAAALQEVFKPGHFLRLYSILTAVDGQRHNLTRQIPRSQDIPVISSSPNVRY
jgi:hypothetical protein